MAQTKIIIIIIAVCLVSLLSGVTPAKIDVVRYFEVEKIETETAEEQPEVPSKTVAAGSVPASSDQDPVVTSPKYADYRLSYAEYGLTWEKFKAKHQRNYTSAREEQKRFAIFMDNVKIIERHNWQFHNGLSTYWMDINQFSDWTTEEWSAFTPVLDFSEDPGFDKNVVEDNTTVSTGAPLSVDWRKQGYVTGVKNQGSCGSCWAFSTTGSVEGQWFRKTRKLVSLSEQQLVDCSSSYGNMGCNGGSTDYSFKYIIQAGGLEGEGDYPYTARQGPCRFQAGKVRARISGYRDVVPRRSETALQNAVATAGPVSVLISASKNFQSYRGGVFVDNTCTQINHAVLVVGYGSSGSQDYWIVKNSWGTAWGVRGYILMARNRGNMCQIATAASYPVA